MHIFLPILGREEIYIAQQTYVSGSYVSIRVLLQPVAFPMKWPFLSPPAWICQHCSNAADGQNQRQQPGREDGPGSWVLWCLWCSWNFKTQDSTFGSPCPSMHSLAGLLTCPPVGQGHSDFLAATQVVWLGNVDNRGLCPCYRSHFHSAPAGICWTGRLARCCTISFFKRGWTSPFHVYEIVGFF